MKKKAVKITQMIGALIAVGFLYMNISAVMAIPSLYSQVADRDEEAMIVFFRKAKSSKEFRELFPEIQQLFVSLENKVYAEDRSRQDEIAYFESLLSYNPNARDVLYTLSLLYEKQGNSVKSAEYLARARVVDPTIGL